MEKLLVKKITENRMRIVFPGGFTMVVRGNYGEGCGIILTDSIEKEEITIDTRDDFDVRIVYVEMQ